MSVLQCESGPHLRGIIDELLEYQLRNQGASKQQALKYLEENRDDYIQTFIGNRGTFNGNI